VKPRSVDRGFVFWGGFDLKIDFIFLLVQKNETKKARPWQLASLHFAFSFRFRPKGRLHFFARAKKRSKKSTPPDNLLFFISRSGRRRIFKLVPILTATAWQNGDSNTKNSPSHFAAHSGKL